MIVECTHVRVLLILSEGWGRDGKGSIGHEMGGIGVYDIEVWGLLFFFYWNFLVILVENVPMVSH